MPTTRRHRSGSETAAPYVAGAPQSWPMITASPSPPSASWSAMASSASARSGSGRRRGRHSVRSPAGTGRPPGSRRRPAGEQVSPGVRRVGEPVEAQRQRALVARLEVGEVDVVDRDACHLESVIHRCPIGVTLVGCDDVSRRVEFAHGLLRWRSVSVRGDSSFTVTFHGVRGRPRVTARPSLGTAATRRARPSACPDTTRSCSISGPVCATSA
jgi:hypothetical protein